MSKSQSCRLAGQKEPACCSALASGTCQAQNSSVTDLCTESSRLCFLLRSSILDLSNGELALLFGQLFQGIAPLPVNICVSDAI